MKIRIIGAIVAVLLALIGTVYIVSYVQNADLRAYNGAQLSKAYFITKEIPAGTFGEEISNFVEVKQIPESALAAGRVKDLSELAGRVAAVGLLPGEQLISSRWIKSSDYDPNGGMSVPDGFQAVTLALSTERVVGGTIKAGDTVGVLISSDGVTKEVLHKVLVLSVQSGTAYMPTTTEQTNTDPISGFMVTFALKTPDVQTVVWGQEFGKIWLTREPSKADQAGDTPTNSGLILQ